MHSEEPPQGEQGKRDKEQVGNIETAAELVEEAKFHLELESSRLDGIRQRSGWLLALDGVILSLIAIQVHEMLDHSDVLGSVGRWIAAGSLIVAVLAILTSVGFALTAILKGRTWRLGDQAVGDLAKDTAVSRDKLSTQRTFLDGLVLRIGVERRSFGLVNRC